MTDDERRFFRMIPIQLVWFLKGALIAYVVFVVKMIFETQPDLWLPILLFIILGLSSGGAIILFVAWLMREK